MNAIRYTLSARRSVGAAFLRDLPQAAREAALVFVALFATLACFLQPPNWNNIPRVAMTAELVQHGRLTIDGYEGLTGDRAFKDGRFYSDKAPGMSLLGAPAGAVATKLSPVGPQSFGQRAWTILAYACNLSVSVLFTALAGALLYAALRLRTRRADAAMAGVVAFALASPQFGWSTIFMGHATASSLLLIGYLALDPPGRPAVWRALAGGLAFGAALCVEYTSAVASCLAGLVLFIQLARRISLSSAIRFFTIAVAAAAIGFAPALVYNTLAFGSPLDLGYSYVQGFEAMKTGFFGINAPDPNVMRELLIGDRRGLIWVFPLLPGVLLGVLGCLTRRDLFAHATAAILILAWYWVYNAGYAYWDGGDSTGPRHMTPGLALLALCFGRAWGLFRPWLRLALGALSAASVLVSWAAAAVTMGAPPAIASPLKDLIFPAFFSGQHSAALTYQWWSTPSLLHFAPPLLIWLTFALAFLRLRGPAPLSPSFRVAQEA